MIYPYKEKPTRWLVLSEIMGMALKKKVMMLQLPVYLFLKIYLFIIYLRDRERERAQVEGGTDGGGENLKQPPSCTWNLTHGSISPP